MAPAQPGSPAPPAPAGATPPHSIEAEQAVLGAVMLSEKAHYAFIVEQDLKPEDFYRARHRIIFEVMSELFDEGVDLDVLSVTEELKARGKLEEVGGAGEIAGLDRRRARRRQPAPLRADRQGERAPAPPARRLLPDPGERLRTARASPATSSTRPSGRSSTSAWAATARTSAPSARSSSRRSRAGRSSAESGKSITGMPLGLRGPRHDHRRLPARQPDHPRRAPVDGQVGARHQHRRERRARQARPAPRRAASRSRCPRASSPSASSPRRRSIKGDDLRKGKVKPELAGSAVLNAASELRPLAALHRRLLRPQPARPARQGAPAAPELPRPTAASGLIIIDYLQLMRADDARDNRVAAGRPDEPRAEDPRPRAGGPGDRALAALPRRRAAHRQAPDALRPARVRADRAGRRPRRCSSTATSTTTARSPSDPGVSEIIIAKHRNGGDRRRARWPSSTSTRASAASCATPRDRAMSTAPCPLGICDGSGWIVDEEARAVRACALPAAADRARAAPRALSAVVPRRYRGVSFDRPPVSEMPRPQVDVAQRVTCARLDERLDQGRGLWFFGGVGTGKTTLAMLVSAAGARGRAQRRDLLAAAPARRDPRDLRRATGEGSYTDAHRPPDRGRPAAPRRRRRREDEPAGCSSSSTRSSTRATRRSARCSSRPTSSARRARRADRRAHGLAARGDVRRGAVLRRATAGASRSSTAVAAADARPRRPAAA